MPHKFADRRAAGRILAAKIREQLSLQPDVLVLALPRGGVPVAAEVAAELHCSLDIVTVRKLGLPGYSELAMGAIGPGGVRVLNDEVIVLHGVTPGTIDAVAATEYKELLRRQRVYRGDRPPPDVRGRQIILVDDGLATGATMRAAIAAVRAEQPAQIVVAVPVAGTDAAAELRDAVDAVICVEEPEMFMAIGQFYADFGQTSDTEVIALLQRAWQKPALH